jgi:hypothetical protein
MHSFSKITMLAVLAGLSAAPAMAAPMNNFGNNNYQAAFCADPAHAHLPQCMPGQPGQGRQHWPQGQGQQGQQQGQVQHQPPMGGGMGFHQRFGGFNFGFFGTPTFSINIGTTVPHSYHSLRPVPRSVYKYYPQYRGYLFFIGRHGDFVIVSPRSHRIVAVL